MSLPPETDSGLADCMEFLTASHRRIACIRRADPAGRPKSRFAAYAAGLEKAGIPLDASLVRTSHHRPATAYQSALELLQLPDRPTAILCTDDMEALQAIRAAYRLGLRVPPRKSRSSRREFHRGPGLRSGSDDCWAGPDLRAGCPDAAGPIGGNHPPGRGHPGCVTVEAAPPRHDGG